MLTGSEEPSNQLAILAAFGLRLCDCASSDSSTANSAACEGVALFGEDDREVLRKGRYVDDLFGLCESLLGNRGGMSIVVLDLA